MIGRSIYVADNPAFVGGSPQAVHEQLWVQGRRRRLQVRGGLAGVGLVLGTWTVALWFGVLAAALIAAAHTLYYWRQRLASSVWRKGRRGERRTARILRATLEWRGFRVLNGRSLPGRTDLDQLVIGAGGVVLIDNRSCPPEMEITAYGDRIYVDGKPETAMISEIRARADAVGAHLSEKVGMTVPVAAVLVLYGGRPAAGDLTAGGVTVLRAHRLPGWIRRRGEALTPAEVAAVAHAAGTLPIARYASVMS